MKRHSAVVIAVSGASAVLGCEEPRRVERIAVDPAPIANGTVQSDDVSVTRPIVVLQDIRGSQPDPRGSGVILSGSVVLLAAHEVCRYVRTPEALQVVRGNGQRGLPMDVVDIILHPRFVPGQKCGAKVKDASGIDGLGGLLDSAPRSSPRLVEDITREACVDERDYEILAESYGFRAGEGADVRADYNADGWVDFFDYLLLVERWRQGIGCNAFHG